MQPVIYLFGETILFIGCIPPNQWHAIPVETLSTNISADFRVQTGFGSEHNMKSIHWPSGLVRNTCYEPSDVLSYMIFPAHLNLYSYIDNTVTRKWPANPDVRYQMKREAEWVDLLTKLYEERPSAEHAKQLINQLLSPANSQCLFEPSDCRTDPRTRKAVKYVREQVILGKNSDIAERLNISQQHLNRLFRKDLHCSLGLYRAHLMMIGTVVLKSQGLSVTQSAIGAGFYDLSHAEKRHKQAYGIAIASTIAKSDLRVEKRLLDELYSYCAAVDHAFA